MYMGVRACVCVCGMHLVRTAARLARRWVGKAEIRVGISRVATENLAPLCRKVKDQTDPRLRRKDRERVEDALIHELPGVVCQANKGTGDMVLRSRGGEGRGVIE